MRVESPTAAMRPLQPPLARVLWYSKVIFGGLIGSPQDIQRSFQLV
jgi:hypothetical protein